jgi:hypothetical protein
MSRSESLGSAAEDAPPPLPDGVDRSELLQPEQGVGPLFHRRYRVRIGSTRCTAVELTARVARDLNAATPLALARFFRVHGDPGPVALGDEFVVRMPGPWDGPVRVVERTETSFRLVTLEGHLEAGQIEFRAEEDDGLVFVIESWARSADRISNLLYHRLRMAKEVQLHMWTSFLENVVKLAGGTRAGRLEITTRRVDD